MAARTWLAVTLSLGVWFAYEQWFAPKRPLTPTPSATVENGTTAGPGTASATSSIQSATAPLGSVYTTREDIDRMIKKLRDIVKLFGK